MSIQPTLLASFWSSESVSSMAVGLRPLPPPYGLSKNHSRSSGDVTMTATPPIIVACTTAPSPLSAKKSMYPSRITAHDPQRRGDHPLGAVGAVGTSVLAIGALVEVLREGRLRGGRARVGAAQGVEQRPPPPVRRVAQ